MLKVRNGSLAETEADYLKHEQKKIDAIDGYAGQVAEATKRWNDKSRSRFRRIRETLASLCPGARRCHYCEDSAADEVEHIWPKKFYPDRAFLWENYLFCCGRCNGTYKGDRFALFLNGGVEVTRLVRGRNDPVVKPNVGDSVFIDPRYEDPLEFIWLDLATAMFVPVADDKESRDYIRAKYTLDEVLNLNRDLLLKARRSAISHYRSALETYVTKREKGAAADELERWKNEIAGYHHPTVWREMIRSRALYPYLDALFNRAPELLKI